MNRSALVLLSSFYALAMGGQAQAQSLDNEQICPGLQKPGLYYVYADAGQIVSRQVGSGRLRYSVNSRFYYVPRAQASFAGRNDEGVWHIRTQTVAADAPRANEAYVYRQPIVSRCSGGVPLFAFSSNERFVPLNRYVDYHAPKRNGREQEPQLRDYFHFKMQNPENGDCATGIRTDAANLSGSLEDIYAFKTVKREDTPTSYEVATTLFGPAVALPTKELTSRYQGLTSEFAYRYTAGNSCVSFSPPLPTGAGSLNAISAAAVWKPKTTSVVLKRFRGRNVVELVSKVISWDGQ
jgi:hypothetical protein